MAFNLNDTVYWTSSVGGHEKTKRGTVIEVVPAGSLPKTKDKDIGLRGRREESYVVRCTDTFDPYIASGGGIWKANIRQTLYWPRTSALRTRLTIWTRF